LTKEAISSSSARSSDTEASLLLPFTFLPFSFFRVQFEFGQDHKISTGDGASLMSAEHPASARSEPQTPADKTDAPHRARQDSVTQLETDDFFCVRPDTPLSEAIEQMKRDEGGCVIVCEEASGIVGIFTERDLLNKIVGQQVDMNSAISEWMSPAVETLTTDATIGDAVNVMNDKSYRNIPLVKDGQLIGSISVFDIITYLAESYPKETMNLPPVPAQVMDTPEGG
jgi:CBS domain-containing protein